MIENQKSARKSGLQKLIISASIAQNFSRELDGLLST